MSTERETNQQIGYLQAIVDLHAAAIDFYQLGNVLRASCLAAAAEYLDHKRVLA